MVSPVFNSILHGDLRPWLADFSDLRRYTDLIKAAALVTTDTGTSLQEKLTVLLADFPGTLSGLKAAPLVSADSLAAFRYDVMLPAPSDIPGRFFHAIITTERARLFNILVQYTKPLTDSIDISYEVKDTLRYLSSQAVNCKRELDSLGCNEMPGKGADPVHFALYSLKLALIALFFDVQETYREHIAPLETEEDFFQLRLHEMAPDEPLLTLIEIPAIAGHITETDEELQPAKKLPGRRRAQAEITESKKKVEEILSFMKGNNPQGQKIMSDSDYNRMINHLSAYLESDKVVALKPLIATTQIPATYIRYSFHLIYKELIPTNRSKKEWIAQLHGMFGQFKKPSPSTTSKKFSEKPPMYDADLKALKK